MESICHLQYMAERPCALSLCQILPDRYIAESITMSRCRAVGWTAVQFYPRGQGPQVRVAITISITVHKNEKSKLDIGHKPS